MTNSNQAFLQSRHTISNYFYGIDFHISELTANYPLHYHDYYELEFVVSGSGSQWLNGQLKRIQTSCLYLLTPSDLHRIEVNERLVIYNIKLIDLKSMNYLSEMLNSFPYNLYFELGHDDGEHVRFMFDLVRTAFNKRNASETIYVQALLTSIIGFMISAVHGEKIVMSSAPTGNRLLDALQYIQKNHTEPLNLKEVAKYVGWSPCHFSNQFTQWVGCHFIEYVNGCRLQHAQRMLLESDKSVSEISYAVGFGCLSQFMRCFKQVFGMSPNQMRQQETRS